MYTRLGVLSGAQRIFHELPVRNVVSWSALITGYAKQGLCEEALNYSEQMRCEGLSPNAITYNGILKACGSIEMGRQIHDEITSQGLLENNTILGNALVDMYTRHGRMSEASQVVAGIPMRDVVTWSALIAGYAEQGYLEKALESLKQMQLEGLFPNMITYICILRACTEIEVGKEIYGEIAKKGLLQNDIALETALVDMYAKSGLLEEARLVLDGLDVRDIVSWTALISGYVQKGQNEEALNCFERLKQEHLAPNAVTFSCILKACASIGAIDKGRQIHDEIASNDMMKNDVVLGSSLVDMYARCGMPARAHDVLFELPVRNIASWSALISGYAQHGEGREVIKCIEQMRREGISPNAITFTSILNGCGISGAIDWGKRLHDEIVSTGLLEKDHLLQVALVNMYIKCGALAKAREAIEELSVKCPTLWTSLISGYAQQGQGMEALNCFEQMQSQGISPNSITLLCVLNACCHSGLVDEGQMYFTNMSKKYGVLPNAEHYTTMVDLYGRAGHLDKAVDLIRNMSSLDHRPAWNALLTACRKRDDVKLGRLAFDQAIL
jgi:pentatricopeptide repeat protein